MSYRFLNNLIGVAVFLIASITYVMTMEPTSSFWDCGEFISTAYKQGIPHPPGAPVFLLIGRLFSMFAGNDVTQVAWWVNLSSALASAGTSLFLFWSITLLAKKFFADELTKGRTYLIMAAGFVGALAYTFTDTAWFSAVEAEVYAMSSFLTAMVYWAMLKWEENFETPMADRWLLLIAYIIGLSIGVHLLNLTAIPALAFIYYFKTRERVNNSGVLVTAIISFALIGIIMIGVIPGLPSIAAKFELLFVNSFHMGFGSGIIFFMALLIGGLIFGVYYTSKAQKHLANLLFLAATFILIGYSSYGVIVIRSQADPSIDMNDPENVMSFISYLKREQYGDRPLLKGPIFTAGYPISKEKGAPVYVPSRDKEGRPSYQITEYKYDYKYDPEHVMLFPRIYSTQASHVRAYRDWLELSPREKPGMGDNIKFFVTYQMGFMYWRYFMWNFVGREGDEQNSASLSIAKWSQEIPAIAQSKARNNYFLLPLILGLMGMYFQIKNKPKDFTHVALLFFFSGLAIVIYLNQPPIEPRERDYTFAGSFYAFSIWLGLGVLFVADLFAKKLKSEVAVAGIAGALCLVVPVVLVQQNWDDHNRSNRYFQIEQAKNLLNSCEQNAILFTGGDNDTYPLWYVQEVEGYRTDVRVCNFSLLNTDWYINQMRRRAYKSEALPISLDTSLYISGMNDIIYDSKNDKFKDGVLLKTWLDLIKKHHRTKEQGLVYRGNNGEFYCFYPYNRFHLPVDTAAAAALVSDKIKPFIVSDLDFSPAGENQGYFDKKTLIVLDILANNNWERPIYFSTTLGDASEYLGLFQYMQQEGLAYRLLPAKIPGGERGWIDADVMYKRMKTFTYRGLDDSTMFYDENYNRFASNHRAAYVALAGQLVREGDVTRAKEVIDLALTSMPKASIPYDHHVASLAQLLWRCGEKDRAMALASDLEKDAMTMLNFLKENAVRNSSTEYQWVRVLDVLQAAYAEFGNEPKSKELGDYLQRYLKTSQLGR